MLICLLLFRSSIKKDGLLDFKRRYRLYYQCSAWCCWAGSESCTNQIRQIYWWIEEEKRLAIIHWKCPAVKQ